jgi:hypothetical protein
VQAESENIFSAQRFEFRSLGQTEDVLANSARPLLNQIIKSPTNGCFHLAEITVQITQIISKLSSTGIAWNRMVDYLSHPMPYPTTIHLFF